MNQLNQPAAAPLGSDQDRGSSNDAEFARRYWRSAPVAPVRLGELSSDLIDDATFRLLADNVPTLCWIANGDGYIVWYNRRWHDYCGTTPEQMEGWGWQAVHDPEQLSTVMERWTAAIESGEPFEMTFPLRGADGVFRPFLTRVQPMRDASGAVARWFGTNTEISDQVAIEEALRAERDRSHNVLDGMTEGFVLLDRDFRLLDINAEGLRIDGRTREQMIGQSHWELWPGTKDTEQGRLYKRVLAGGGSEQMEGYYRWEDGREAWLDIRAYPHPEGLAIFYRDIGDRKRAELKTQNSEEFTRLLLNSTSEAFYAVNRDGVTTLCNDAFLDLLGFTTRDDVIGRKLHDVIHHSRPDGSPYPSRDCPIYQAASQGRSAFVSDELFFRLDGSSVPVEYRAEPIVREGELQGAICTFYDISDRLVAERALTEQARTLEILNRTGAALAGELDLERLVQRVTDAGVELIGAQFGAFFYNVLDEAGESYMLYTLSGAPRSAFENFGMPRATAVFQPTFKGEGVIRSDDILADPRYGKSAPHWGMPKGHLPVRSYLAVSVTSRSGEVIGGLFFGHEQPAAFTARHEELIAGIAGQAAVAIDNARLFQTTQRLNETLESRVIERTAELEHAQEALRQAQKMEAVGQLTGGIAHDFNNLLTGVIGSLDMMQRQIARGQTDKIERYTTTAMTAANRAAALTHRLLAFARRQPLDPKPVNANRLVTGMEELLRRTIGESIQLQIVTAGGLWQTLCDPHQLESAILNLAINARDAMPDGGQLTIETCNAHLDNAYAAQQRDVIPGQYICICVTDTGTGMNKDTIGKAFEPFFTTKPIGQGTGLGLSMIYGFTRQSQGYARIYSEEGEGTTIKLYLPRYYGEAEEIVGGQGELTGTHWAQAGEVVLVVEDETAVRDLVVEVLEELGYRAIEAVDGAAGLKVLQSKMRLDLLITDIGLPGLNGRQLADAAREHRPDLKVLFMTGYAENATIANGFLEPGMQMITKPFAVEALVTRIRDIIEGNENVDRSCNN